MKIMYPKIEPQGQQILGANTWCQPTIVLLIPAMITLELQNVGVRSSGIRLNSQIC